MNQVSSKLTTLMWEWIVQILPRIENRYLSRGKSSPLSTWKLKEKSTTSNWFDHLKTLLPIHSQQSDLPKIRAVAEQKMNYDWRWSYTNEERVQKTQTSLWRHTSKCLSQCLLLFMITFEVTYFYFTTSCCVLCSTYLMLNTSNYMQTIYTATEQNFTIFPRCD